MAKLPGESDLVFSSAAPTGILWIYIALSEWDWLTTILSNSLQAKASRSSIEKASEAAVDALSTTPPVHRALPCGGRCAHDWACQPRIRQLVDITPEHPMLSALYHVRKIPQIPSIQNWRRMGGGTSERGRESAKPYLRAILDAHGRVQVMMSHNTDIADGWEREGENREYFFLFSPDAYAVVVNVLLWAMTH